MTGPAARHGVARTEGTVIVLVVGVLLLLSAMGLALVLVSSTNRMASDNLARAGAAFYAADAAIERALPDLLRVPDWNEILGGGLRSGFADGPPSGPRVLADGRTIVLDEIVSLANCGSAAGCTAAAMDAVTAERPWGPNNPRWSLFAYGRLSTLSAVAGAQPPDHYVVVLVADDSTENDNDPLRDAPAGGRGTGVIQLRAEAFGPLLAHRVVEVTVARGVPASGSNGYAAQRGQGASAGQAGDGVQLPGATLSRSELSLGGGMTRQ